MDSEEPVISENEDTEIIDEDTSNDDEKADSSDSMDDEEDAKMLEEIDVLNKKIQNSPYDYQSQVQRINLLRECGEYEQLQSARKQMADIFPLTEEMWLHWLEDEQKFAESDEEHLQLESLFDRAVQDYMCPDIWLEYAQYSIRFIGKEGGFEKIRGIANRALSAAGLHVRKGANLWDAYREIEHAILAFVKPEYGSVATPQQEHLILEQTARISALFRRQLRIPLLGMEETEKEFQEWRSFIPGEDDFPGYLQDAYHKALTTLQELTPLEDELEENSSSTLDIYKKYIEVEKRSNDPARVQCIYERAIAQNCLNSELWNGYLTYLNRTLKSGPIVVSTYERAVRNCPWASALWQDYLVALERNGDPYDKIEKVYKEALQVGFSTPGDYACLFQTWCDFVRRHYCNGSDKDELGRLLRQAFESTTSYLLNTVLPAFNGTGDPDYTLWCYWARCEAAHLKNMVKARQIIDVIMEDDADARRNWKIWRDYYEMERLYGDVEHCREVLRRAVQSSAADDGGAELACDQLIRFERENGSLQDLDEARKKTEGRLAKVQKRKEKAALQMQERKKKWEENGQVGKKGKKREKPQEKKQAPKRQAPFKERKESKEIPEKRSKTNVTPTDDEFKTPNMPVRFNKTSPKSSEEPNATVTIAPPPGFHENIAKKNTPENTPSNKPPTDREGEERTVFLSNLGYEVESIEDKLKKIFSPCGEIASVRLARGNKGNFRGFAYIEFDHRSSVEEALKLDRTPLEGRPMYVSPNVDKSKHPDFKVFKYSTGMEKHKLFVSGLCFDTTEDTLRGVFSSHGPLKSLRIATARNGKSKGIAYIEYEKEADATQAVMKTDETVLDGFTIKVAISNPPVRNRPVEERTLGGGGGKGQVVGGRGRGRTQVSLLPRSLQKSSNRVDPAQTKPDGGATKPMSNQDFAKMLLKQ